MAALLSIEEALAGCSRAPGRSSPSRFRSPRPPDGYWPRTWRRWSTCRRFRARRWTVLRSGRRTCPANCRSSSGSPRAGRPTVARGRRGDGDLDGRHGARRGGRRCADRERCRTRQQHRACRSVERGSARPADRRRRARRRAAARRRERGSVPLRSARSLRPGSPRSRAPAGPGWSFSAPGPSCGRRARRSARARSTSRTAPCWRRRSRPQARWSTGSGRSQTTRTSTAARSSGGSRRTSSSAPAACPSDRTTSCAAILGELGVEEDFWGVAVKPGKPLSFATRGATLVFGLPGNPVSALVAVELFVRPALRGAPGRLQAGPELRSARLASPVRRNATRDELVRARTARDGR